MREVKVGTFEVKAEVIKTMIEDLNNMRSFDFTAKLEEDLVRRVTRPLDRKNSINKIYSS